MVKYTVIAEIAGAVDAIHRLKAMGRTKTKSDWQEFLRWIEVQHLPRGAGIDNGTTIDWEASTRTKVIIYTAYHHMNDAGYYDGWTGHTVTVKPAFNGVEISVKGPNRDDINDYLAEIFEEALLGICHIIDGGRNEYGHYHGSKWIPKI